MHRFVACAPGSRRSSAPGNGATVCVECDGEASPKPPPKCISPPPPTTSSALSTFSRRKHELRPASDDHRRTAHTKRRHATPIFIPRTGLIRPGLLAGARPTSLAGTDEEGEAMIRVGIGGWTYEPW